MAVAADRGGHAAAVAALQLVPAAAPVAAPGLIAAVQAICETVAEPKADYALAVCTGELIFWAFCGNVYLFSLNMQDVKYSVKITPALPWALYGGCYN